MDASISMISSKYDQLMTNGQNENRYPMKKEVMLKGLELALITFNNRLGNSKLLLKSDYPYDAFILYSFSSEEFGKAYLSKTA